MAARPAELRALHRGRAQPRSPAPSFDPSAHPAEHVARAARGWQKLLDGERDSFVAAAMIAADLGRIGAPEPLLAEASRVVEDEARHVLVASTMVRALGAEPTTPDPDTTRADLGKGTLRERLVRTLVAGFVVGESLSAATFAAARARPMVPIARWAYDELLQDEATHGGFGERAGAWLMRDYDDAACAALWPACVLEMQAFERIVGGPVDDAAIEREKKNRLVSELSRLGLMSPAASCAATLDGIERWALPRLRRMRVIPAVPEAWRAPG